jgi:hypothetical protein
MLVWVKKRNRRSVKEFQKVFSAKKVIYRTPDWLETVPWSIPKASVSSSGSQKASLLVRY